VAGVDEIDRQFPHVSGFGQSCHCCSLLLERPRLGAYRRLVSPVIRTIHARVVPSISSIQEDTMSRIHRTIAAAALVALTSIGVLVGTVGTASAAGGPAVCNDFGRILIYYVEVGDQATALALFDNMIAMGCT
jgi:hypothetical protein